MILTKHDKQLLNSFFQSEKEWMKNNSLRKPENVAILKGHFLEFMKSKGVDTLPICEIFTLELDCEILACRKDILYKEKYIKTLPLKLAMQACKPHMTSINAYTDNDRIMNIINKCNVHEVEQIPDRAWIEVNQHLQRKLTRNLIEKQKSAADAKNYIVG